ncbi:galactan beta-1,4-galactosyltransferase GALS1-like [Phragmites australis]|uniref:galactan beta-1,4-galactosyltransferase GALS1-like n=1 Tax=Phragmites australis TaxID=29695 RepID=UPI002D786B0D|nr:galactan beta-1,4-galactosyltransferase GALS1-like [Phragmites australis]
MKPAARKDAAAGGGGGGGGVGAFGVSCFDFKSFVASIALLTLVIALWQLHPYGPFLSASRPYCPLLPRSLTKASSHSAAATFPSANSTFAAVTTAAPTVASAATTMPGFLPAARPRDPNKRELRPYGSAAALFVQMGAYRGGPRTFAVVGLASKPAHVFGTPYFKCEWVPSPDPASPSPPRPVRTKAYKMLPDWGYGRVYTVVVVNCTFPSNPNAANSGGKLLVHAYYSTASRRYERFVALEEAPGSYDESRFRPPFPYEYLYCGSSLYGNLSAARMREWLAYHAQFFGPKSHFVLHDAGGVSPEVRAVLDPWVRDGRVTVQDIRAQAEYDGYYYNQFLVVNDCLHRYRHAANWTFFFDVDEYIYLPDGRTLQEVLGQLERYTQFTIEQNPMSSKLCVEDPTKDYPREWGFEKLVFRNSITGVRRDRKYAIQARNAYSTGVHMSQNVYGRTTHKTESLIRYYHYHNSINVMGELCREFVPKPTNGSKVMFEGIPYVYDDNMKRLAAEIKSFLQETVG